MYLSHTLHTTVECPDYEGYIGDNNKISLVERFTIHVAYCLGFNRERERERIEWAVLIVLYTKIKENPNE